MLSEANAGSPAAMVSPAVAVRSSASRRVRTLPFEDSDMNPSPVLTTYKWDSRSTLLGQGVLPVDVELSGSSRRSSIGLASANTDGVVPLRDDRIAFLIHH